jgi:hypothetical protein
MAYRWLRFLVAGVLLLGGVTSLPAQVHYHDNDSPWGQRAEAGPDADVPGWFYNLGITGLRAQLVADQSKALLVRYVFPKSPADGLVQIGDLIVGAGGQLFEHPHRNGYGEQVFGADGPIAELARVLEDCQGVDGKLSLTLQRGGETKDVILDVGSKYGSFAATYPGTCAKSDKILAELLEYVAKHQQEDGSFGDPVDNTFAPLALLATGDAKYLPALERNVRYHSRECRAKENRYGLVNWTYMTAAIVMSEYYLATGEKWVLPELQEVHDRLARSQYLRMSQINPKAKKSHPHSFPKGPKDAHGGWGHNPGFEGYGPIAMLTGQGALAYSLLHRCGIKIDREKHDAAFTFLKKGTGENGYVWYGDQIGGPQEGWADMGRTGASAIANFLSPYAEPVYRERAASHAKVIGKHPQSFPDTHGSPLMGMGYTALAAHIDADSFRKLMDANRWWFTMAHCTDGSFYYQPNRDNAGYGSNARRTASSVVAFIFSIPKQSLVITGKQIGLAEADAASAENSEPPPRETRDVSGWKVHIQLKLLEAEPVATERAIVLLKQMLDEIERVVPAPAVAELRKVPLYFSPAYPGQQAGAEFHPDAGWLRDNGRDPLMEGAVEFSGVHDFEAETKRMPNFALHELAHAYHHRVLKDGFNHAGIIAAYDRVKAEGKYNRVKRTFGGARPSTVERAYAMTTPMEYFAETTEAYFSQNDFFPFNNDELKQHDPEMFSLLTSLWQVRAAP